MPLICDEKLGSRATKWNDATGVFDSMETIWFVLGTNSEVEAKQKFVDTAPPMYWDAQTETMGYRGEMSVEQVGDEIWDCAVSYTPADADQQQSTFSFNTTGGTTHVTQSFGTRRYGVDAPDHKGAIGVQGSGGNYEVEGVDVVIPALSFSETHYLPSSAITAAYVATLAAMTGKVNAGQWRNFAAYTTLFKGAQGQSQTDGLVPVTFEFEVSSNAEDLTVGGIEGIAKYGHEYLWCQYEAAVDATAKRVLPKPKWVFVETVYQPVNFNLLGI